MYFSYTKLLIWHIFDVMHCEKNIAQNPLYMLMGMKDDPAIRKDMKEASCKKSTYLSNETTVD